MFPDIESLRCFWTMLSENFLRDARQCGINSYGNWVLLSWYSFRGVL